MNDESKVSIIIPVYNAELYLNRCINSILNQKYSNFQLILIDDGSTDNSLSICEEFESKDKRIKVINQENSGVSAARNRGIDNANGRYITFVDADDYIFPNYLSVLVQAHNQYNAQYVCCSYQMEKTFRRTKLIVYEDKKIVGEKLVSDFISLVKYLANAPWGKLFETNIIKHYNVRFPFGVPYGEDTIFNIEYFKHINSIAIISDILYNYNFTNSNAAMKKFYPDLYKYFKKVMIAKQEFFEAKGDINFYEDIYTEEGIYYFERCLKHYILHMNNLNNICKLLKKTADLLMQDFSLSPYKRYIEKSDWNGIIVFWKKKHRKELIMYKLKDVLGV